MTKHIIIGDVHFGVKNGCKIMLQHQIDFFYKQVLPYAKANSITSIWQTGDLFDVRKSTNHLVLHSVRKLMHSISSANIDFNGIIGNHDTFHKNNNDINSPNMFLGDYYSPVEHFSTFMSANRKNVGDVDFVGWMNDENTEYILEKVSNSKSRFCFGHFEFSGFEMSKGHIMEHGLNPDLFYKYDLVISGHYHSISKKNNVVYVGTPMQFTWGDFGEDRGFWEFDDVDGHMTFIKNPVELFVKLVYDEDRELPDISQCKNKWVRLTVKNKTDQKLFDSFVDAINKVQPAEVKIIEDLMKQNENYKIETVDITNAASIMKEYVEQTEFPNLDSTKIYERLNEIYKEALLKK